MSKREMAARVFGASALGKLLDETTVGDGLLVVNYHRVGDREASPLNRDVFSATVDAFEAQIRLFKESFDVVSPDDLPHVRGRRGRYLQVTFDDGYRDNYELAYPVLRRHGVPATFFLATGFLDEPRIPWWDELSWMVQSARRDALPSSRWVPGPLALDTPSARSETLGCLSRVYNLTALADRDALLDWVSEATGAGRAGAGMARELWMTWDMVREMHRGGMHVGGHTVHHVELSRLSREAQAEEIGASKRRIVEETGARVSVFAYPFGWQGSFNDDTRACLRESGYAFAYSFYGGYQTPAAWDPYELRRVAIDPTVGQDLLSAMRNVPGWFARPWDDPFLDFGRLRARITGKPAESRRAPEP